MNLLSYKLPGHDLERLWVVEDLKGRYRNGRNDLSFKFIHWTTHHQVYLACFCFAKWSVDLCDSIMSNGLQCCKWNMLSTPSFVSRQSVVSFTLCCDKCFWLYLQIYKASMWPVGFFLQDLLVLDCATWFWSGGFGFWSGLLGFNLAFLALIWPFGFELAFLCFYLANWF